MSAAAQWIGPILECGAAGAEVICREQVVLSREFRDICRGNGCGQFGRCWVCPPDVGEIESLMERVRQYPTAILYQSISAIEDSFDFEGMNAAGDAHMRLSQRIGKLVKVPLHLTCGGCHLCKVCTKPEGRPCRHPDLALPSMEGYGVDVYRTARNTSLKYINGANTVTYFGMLFFKEPEEP